MVSQVISAVKQQSQAMKTLLLITVLSLGCLTHTLAHTPYFPEPVSKAELVETATAAERKSKKIRLKKFRRSVKKGTDLSKFSYHQKLYVIDAPIDSVWNMYTSVKPKEAWAGPLNTFKHAYSPSKDSLYLSTDSILPSLEHDMVYELNLRVAGILNVGVAFQITDIDPINKVIEFTYGEDNASHGRQRIMFSEDGDSTYIIHYSNFKSTSKFRDKFLYPTFHERCMDEFHGNLKGMIEGK